MMLLREVAVDYFRDTRDYLWRVTVDTVTVYSIARVVSLFHTITVE